MCVWNAVMNSGLTCTRAMVIVIHIHFMKLYHCVVVGRGAPCSVFCQQFLSNQAVVWSARHMRQIEQMPGYQVVYPVMMGALLACFADGGCRQV